MDFEDYCTSLAHPCLCHGHPRCRLEGADMKILSVSSGMVYASRGGLCRRFSPVSLLFTYASSDSPSSPNTIPKLPMGEGLMGGRHRLQAWPFRACKHAVNGGVNISETRVSVSGGSAYNKTKNYVMADDTRLRSLRPPLSM